jgi:response regulator NasT
LPVNEYWPVHTTGSAGEARRRFRTGNYDIVVINTPLPDDFGTSLAIDIAEDSSASVMTVVKSEVYESVFSKLTDYGVAVLSKPANTHLVAQTFRVLCATRERLRRIEGRQATVEEKMAEVRLINRAKWALIEQRGMSEDEAHKYIERQAMDRRLNRRVIAEEILKTTKEEAQ